MNIIAFDGDASLNDWMDKAACLLETYVEGRLLNDGSWNNNILSILRDLKGSLFYVCFSSLRREALFMRFHD